MSADLPATINACGVELRRLSASKFTARWERVLVDAPRTRIGIESSEFGARIYRCYLTSDGGPDFSGAYCDTTEGAAADLARLVSVLRGVVSALPTPKEATRG